MLSLSRAAEQKAQSGGTPIVPVVITMLSILSPGLSKGSSADCQAGWQARITTAANKLKANNKNFFIIKLLIQNSGVGTGIDRTGSWLVATKARTDVSDRTRRVCDAR